ncbi:zinc finger protein isoform 2, partial [Aphelenchoides avenae]
MSLLREPKIELEDTCDSDCNELRSTPVVGTGSHCELPASSAIEPIGAKDEIEEDVWEAIEDGPLGATPAESEQKCFIQNRCDSVVTLIDGTKKRKGGIFKCEMCGCFRSTNQSLQRHMRTHTDERPFKCPLCVKEFRLNCTLQDHMSTHSSD